MIELPAALAPWAPELARFPRDIALGLGAILPTVALALGPHETRSLGREGDPDGYDGLATRGPYHRLLSTEWALALEIPEEFLRRAAMNEHAFLALARKQPASGRVLKALFDAGPSQIGAPRIAHLAILIALAQRARAMNATLLWGVLQNAASSCRGEVRRIDVHFLLQSRSDRVVSESDVAHWRAALADRDGEAWLIGADDVEAFARDESRLLVSDVEVPGARRVSLTRARRNLDSQRVVLDLPPSQLCARLLRSPFENVPPIALSATSLSGARLVFSGDGRRLFVRRSDGVLVGYSVPSSARATSPAPVIFVPPKGHVVVACDWRRRSGVVVTQAGAELQVHACGPHGGASKPPLRAFGSGLTLGPVAKNAPLARLTRVSTDREFFVHPDAPVEIAQTLYRRSSVQAAVTAGHGVIALERAHGEGDGVDRVIRCGPSFDDLKTICTLPGEGALALFVGGPGVKSLSPFSESVAVSTGERHWTFATRDKPTSLIVPQQMRVIGVARGVSLVAIAGEHDVVLLSSDAVKSLARAPAAITDACVAGVTGYVAFVTRAGDLVVRRILQGDAVLEVREAAE